MDDEKLVILKMLQEGKITAEEAAKLLEALEGGAAQKQKESEKEERSSGEPGRWFRVIVTDTETGKTRANLRIPLGVVNAGMKMGAHFNLNMNGTDSEEVLKAVQSGLTGQILDVYDDEDGEHVEIFIE